MEEDDHAWRPLLKEDAGRPGEISVAALRGAYRRLVFWFSGQWIVALVAGLQPLVGKGIAGVYLILGVIAGSILVQWGLVYYGYRTARALGSGVSWLWGLAMFVPLANVISLLSLSFWATRICKANGIPVGLFGPKA